MSITKERVWSQRAIFTSESDGRFTDKDFHAFLKQHRVERELKPMRTEWHHFGVAPRTSLEYFHAFASQDCSAVQRRT